MLGVPVVGLIGGWRLPSGRGSRPRVCRRDLAVQGKHGVEYLHYSLNEADGTVFCLCRAPSKEAAEAVHRKAHGGVADEIIEVQEGK